MVIYHCAGGAAPGGQRFPCCGSGRGMICEKQLYIICLYFAPVVLYHDRPRKESGFMAQISLRVDDDVKRRGRTDVGRYWVEYVYGHQCVFA